MIINENHTMEILLIIDFECETTVRISGLLCFIVVVFFLAIISN